MSNLHLLSTPVEKLTTREILVDAISKIDKIVLYQEAIFSEASWLEDLRKRCEVLVLAEDLALYHQATPTDIAQISYSQWAELIATAHTVNTWV